jgi:XTP/dITP diphosphohydrolase
MPLSRPLLLIATANPGKFRELGELLADLPLRLQSLADFPDAPEVAEEGDTYAANALHKAETIARWSGRVALADDSGLEVDVLGGAPGVRSARYAGMGQDSRANIRKLLDALAGVPLSERTARFRCVIVVARPDGATLTADGSCNGVIIDAPRGRDGFGYDPVFLYPPTGLTLAEMPAAAKNRVSHRARACAELRERLLPFLSEHPVSPPKP